ncbi:hypothetical protein DEJ50_12845 [Streptomyces venezuelae]|uniref:DUF916 domain-containing protein n=1 Tax=Streptomyces venezuelae TaxID=54571 RepID=A0A5P2D1Y4_STRVZ|nr:hypothetical protein [Streptomyces venezuelae]QES48580.1 hypothetical protein DEJ50_12845 [Streptomyces venezuelae]
MRAHHRSGAARALAPVAALVLGALLSGAPTARAAEPGWTAEPAARPGAPAARPFFYLEGTPGTVLEDRLALANPTDRERTVTLRGADAYNTADGALAVRPADRPAGNPAGKPPGKPAAAGGWISFGGHATVRIPPRNRAVVPFTVTLPPDAVPGDHPVALVAAEGGHEAGVRVHLRVTGPTLAALTVEDVSVTGRGAAAEVRYTLVNRGNVALTPELALHADGLFGGLPGRPAHRVPVELLPGQRVTLTEPWPGAPKLDAVDLTLTATAPGGARATASVSARFVPWPVAVWAGGGLLVLVGAAPAARFLSRARRTPRPAGPEPAEPSVREPELTGVSK